jgi:hypothetical protein
MTAHSTLGVIGAVWGIGGVLAVLVKGVVGLAPYAREALSGQLGPLEWLALIASLLFMGYSEGYKAFHKQFSPRVVARSFALLKQPEPLRVLLAPAFAAGLFGATRRRKITSWCVTIGVIMLIILVRMTPQPWRGFIDAGVIVGLSWGAIAIVAYTIAALRGRPLPVSDDIPT